MLNHSCTGLTGVRSPAFAPSVALLVASFKKIWFFSSSLFQSLIPETLASDVFVCSYSLQTLTFFVRYSVFKVQSRGKGSARIRRDSADFFGASARFTCFARFITGILRMPFQKPGGTSFGKRAFLPTFARVFARTLVSLPPWR